MDEEEKKTVEIASFLWENWTCQLSSFTELCILVGPQGRLLLEVVGISSEEAESHMKGQNICPKHSFVQCLH
jgi:hypothetical protein